MMHKFLMMGVVLMAASPAYAQKGPPKGPQQVIVAAVTQSDFADRVEALGTLRANETVTLTATVTETVTAINYEDGQRVEAGDVLIEMTNGQEKAELDAEQAMVDEARRQAARLKPLVESGASSKSLLDERQRDFQTAKARLDAIKSRLADRIITAPFSGVVGLRNISVGTVLQPGTKITTIDEDSVMKLDFSVPSVFLEALKPGLDIVATSNSFPGKQFKGQIYSIDSQIDPMTRALMVRAMIPNNELLLKPGLLMSVEILKNPRVALTAPEEAIVPEARKNFVYVLNAQGDKMTVKKTEVTLGTRRSGEVEILKGLNAGDKVVTHGTLNVGDGAEVAIKAEEKDGTSLPDMLKPAAGKDGK